MLPILALLTIGLIFWFVYDKRQTSDYPPGPLRIPFLGCLLQIARLSPFPHIAIQKLSKVYGDVVYIRMGFTNAITFNTFQTIRDILSHEHASERASDMLPIAAERLEYKNLGIIFGNGKSWQTLRRFTIRTLRDFGFGKAASMDVVINEELDKFTEYVETLTSNNPDGIKDAHKLVSLSIVNVLWRLVTGVNYELNDAKILQLLHLNHELFQTTNFGMDLAIAYPQLYHIFPEWMGKRNQVTLLNKVKGFIRETIEHHRKLGDYQISPKSYVDEFLSKIDENKGNPDSEYTGEHLLICLLDLFQAGSDTTNNTLSFSILYMILHPEIQGKVQAEIDANVPKNECIILETKGRLPYTYATLLECIRYSTVVPIGPARQASKDFYFNGHLIKKGMGLIPNIYAVHFSEDIWGDPHNFRPQRFLTQEGEVDVQMANYLLPFGHGSRKCLAASLAETSLFLYFTTVLRRFKIVKADEAEDLSIVPNLGVTLSPKAYKARFVRR